ncbi:RagB/SusD family nutrient uptake outer membrane protein [soil metagenome]
MKRLPIKLYSVALAATLALTSSCQDYLDINRDPNNLTEVPVQFLLPGSQVGTGFLLGNTIQNVNSLWVQHIAGTGTQTDPYDRYNINPADLNNEWNGLYANLLDDLKEVEAKGQAEGNFQHAGKAQVLQAYVWAVVTDTWGDVPFQQAHRFTEFPQPNYDPQQEVYAGLITLLDAGIANLGKGNVIPATSGDLIYPVAATSADQWIRAANSIKLKLYLQSRHKNANSAAAINALIAGNRLITSNANNFNVEFFGTSGSQNPMYQYHHLTRANDQLISTRFYDSLTVLNDPRIPYLMTRVNNSTYVTYENGVHTSTPFVSPNRSRWGVYIVGNGPETASGTINNGGAAPFRMITSYMVKFWLAEAALTLGTTGTPATYFEEALRDHFEDIRTFTVANAATFNPARDTYIASRLAAFQAKNSTLGKLNVLIRDKWVTTTGNAYEAYNDYRRTGFPRLALPQNRLPGVTRIPTRWPYVQEEIQANSENVPIQDYPSGLLVPVWWMPQ